MRAPNEETHGRHARRLTEFAEIVEDGVITPEELEMVPEIKRRFTEARQKVDEMLAAIEKIEARKVSGLRKEVQEHGKNGSSYERTT